jgi:predicted DNA binding CopG/RHH family protein
MVPKKRRNYKKLGEFEMPPGMATKVDAMKKHADEEDELARVNFRRAKEPLEVVKHAAKLMGIPYQTFIKQTVFEHALKIIRETESSKKSA